MTPAENQVFVEKPRVVYVDEDHSVKPPKYSTIDNLITSLKEYGPLIAEGKMGPGAYTEPSFKLKDQVNNQDVYGWKPNTRKEGAPQIPVILLGARQTDSKNFIYFTLARDITRDEKSLIRGFTPSETDTKIYVMSYENFLNSSLFDLHPICPHADWLYSVSANSLLDGGQIEAKCKQVGQQIFDHYKTKASGDSEAGRNALVRICNAAKFLTPEKSVHKAHIEHAWSGVGDTNWRWQH